MLRYLYEMDFEISIGYIDKVWSKFENVHKNYKIFSTNIYFTEITSI